MSRKPWWRGQGRPSPAELEDAETVLVELLMALPRESLRRFLRESLRTQRDLNPSEAVQRQRGVAFVCLLGEAQRRRPDLLRHFGGIPQVVLAFINRPAAEPASSLQGEPTQPTIGEHHDRR